MMHFLVRLSCVAALSLAITACDRGEDYGNLATLDAELTNNVTDPALGEAVEGPLATDSELAGTANRDAVRPSDRPLTGAVPAKLSPQAARAGALKLAGGKLMQTPPASKSVKPTDEPVTLGGKAERKQRSGCGEARVTYAMAWAHRTPAEFPVYPGGQVTEAAGTDAACGLRAVSFTTLIPQSEVMDFYYTMARRAGYTVEHIEENGEHVLGGTRTKGDRAFYVSLRSQQGGGTTVDLIANGGR